MGLPATVVAPDGGWPRQVSQLRKRAAAAGVPEAQVVLAADGGDTRAVLAALDEAGEVICIVMPPLPPAVFV